MVCETNLKFFRFESKVMCREGMSTSTMSVLKTIPIKSVLSFHFDYHEFNLDFEITSTKVTFTFGCASIIVSQKSLSIKINPKITFIGR